MMSITRSVVERPAGRSLAGVAFAALLVAGGVLLTAGPADADANSPPSVYYSPGDDGQKTPRPDCPPGCLPVVEGGACGTAGNTGPYEAIENGSFESAGVGGISNWIVNFEVDPGRGIYEGSFYRASGTSLPVSTVYTDHTAVGASDGVWYAVSDQFGPTSTALSQAFTVPAGATSVSLSYDMFVNDWLFELSVPSPIVGSGSLVLDVDNPRQFARVDILTADAFDADPFTTDVVVQTLYPPGIDPGMPPLGYQSYAFDLTSALGGGGTFVLRFAQIDTEWYLNQGVDNVSLVVTPGEGTPPPPMNCAIQGGAGEELFLYIDGGPAETAVGTECNMDVEGGGDGDELCGANVQFDLEGFGAFTQFFPGDPNLEVPDPGLETLVWYPNCLPETCDDDSQCITGPCDLDSHQCAPPPGCGGLNDLPSGTTQLRMVFRRGDQTTDLPAGARRLGKLVLNSVPPEGEEADTKVFVSGVEGVGAKLQVRRIAAGGLAPEIIAQSVPEPGGVAQIVSGLLGLGALQWLRRRRGSG